MFSIIVPIHNKARHLARALDSVLAQSWQEFEIVAIDDASTDDSLAVLQRYDDPRIVTLCRETPGPGGYAARNLGLEHSRFDRIAFLDADDAWMPDHLERARAILDAHEELGFVTSCYVKQGGAEPVVRQPLEAFGGRDWIELDLRAFLDHTLRGRPPIWTSVLIARKEPLVGIGGFPEGQYTRGGDIETWLKLVARTRGAWRSEISATYYIDSDNMVTASVKDEVPAPYFGVRELLRHERDPEIRRALQRFNNHYQRFTILKAKRKGVLTRRHLSGYFPLASPIHFAQLAAYALLPRTLIARIDRARAR